MKVPRNVAPNPSRDVLYVVVLAALCGALVWCGSGCAPVADVTYHLEGADDDQAELVWQGSQAWNECGFVVEWVDRAELGAEHHVTVRLEPLDHLCDGHKAGLASIDRREIRLHNGLGRWQLLHTSGHEWGHVLLDTSEHLAGVNALMTPGASTSYIRDADRELACRVAGRCCR